MNLYFRKSGSGEPFIILHGLYGSSDNWYSIGRELSDTFTVYMIDQRNHGNSPRDPLHNYDVLSHDLYEFLQQHEIHQSILMGHSMGGKTALAFGLKHPELVKKMIVVDISPMGYDNDAGTSETGFHRNLISSLQQIDVGIITSRQHADQLLKPSISSVNIRQFLLKSLKRTPDGKFTWALNLQALAENMTAIFAGVIEEGKTDPRNIPQFPLLFIKGEKSGYLRPGDKTAISHYFPWSHWIEIPDSGHWVHAEQPEAFVEIVKNFCLR